MTSRRKDFVELLNEHHDDEVEDDKIDNLLVLSSLLSHHTTSDTLISSESRLVHSKFQRLFHFLLTDIYNEPVTQAIGDHISNVAEVDDALINLSRNATLQFRNYKQLREQLGVSSSSSEQNRSLTSQSLRSRWTHFRQSFSSSNARGNLRFRLRSPLIYFIHWLIHSSLFEWFISIVICLDAISVAVTSEYSSPDDSSSIVYSVAIFINRCILFIYLFEVIFKWIDDFINFWYSPANILEFILTVISLTNLISEIYLDSKNSTSLEISRKFHSNSKETNTLQRIKTYGSILSLLRTLRMLRVLRILEITFRFTQVRIVFLALSRSVKLIFHVVLLTVVLIYFFALIGLYLTQFGLNRTSNEDREKINALFGTVPRAFITVFRIFTKDEWFEIKAEMYSLKMSPVIIDLYVMSWLFFGGYVLNPLLIGAMVGTFDETRKELIEDAKRIISKTNLTKSQSLTSIYSSFLAHVDSLDNDNDRFNDWLRLTADEIRLLMRDRMETQWPIHTVFSYLQLLEIYFENIAERQLLFDFFSLHFLTLHDKETKSMDSAILSSSSSSDDDDD